MNTVYYTVVAERSCPGDDIDQTIYKTTQLMNLSSILDLVEGGSYDHIDLTISDGYTTLTVEVAS